jgi:hypothetical protein
MCCIGIIYALDRLSFILEYDVLSIYALRFLDDGRID